MEIKAAMPEDVASICELYAEFFKYNASLQPEYYKSGRELGGYPNSTIESVDSDILIAVNNNKICGFIHIKESETPPFDAFVQHRYAEIIDFIVTKRYRRGGVGTMLMDAAKQWSKSRGLEYVELSVLSNANGEKCFYEQADFQMVSHTMRCSL